MTGTSAGAGEPAAPGGPASVGTTAPADEPAPPAGAPLPWLAELSALGGFFELAAPPAAGTDAVPWDEMLGEKVLARRFATVRAALAGNAGLPLADVDPRVAVSATQVSLVSRLWSVALGSTVLQRWLPDLSVANLVASPVHGGPVPLGLADPGAGRAVDTPSAAAAAIGEWVTAGSLASLDQACARVGRTAERVLVSNAASSLTGAARVLAARRPHAAAATGDVVRRLLADPRLSSGGGIDRSGRFLRGGCCLFYRLPGHGLCPDCVLALTHPDRVSAAH